MGVRLTNTHVSKHQGVIWQIEIHDRNFTGTPVEFRLRGEGYILNYEGGDVPFNPIISSKVNIPIVVESDAFDSFVTDIIASNEERFYVVIKKNNLMEWTGRVLIEQFQRENKYYPYTFSITAVDGLALLKEIPYNNNGVVYGTDETTLTEHILRCLNKIGLNHLYSLTDNFLTTSVSWKETNQVLTPTTDALIKTRTNPRAFWTQNSKGEYSYKSSYEVLSQICQLFGARILMAKGGFRFIQVNEYANSNGALKEIRYNANGDYKDKIDSILSVLPLNQIDRIKLGGGIFRYLPALKSIENEYNHRGADNYISGAKWSNVIKDTYDISYIETSGGEDKLLVKLLLEWQSVNQNPVDSDYVNKFRIEIKIGDFYLKRVATINQYNVFYTSAEWTNTQSYYEIVTKFLDSKEAYHSGTLDISFKTPLILYSGDATVKFEDVGTFDLNNASMVTTRLYDVYNPSIEFLKGGKTVEREESRTYELINTDNLGNSKVLKLKSFLGDGATSQSIGKLSIFDGSFYSESQGWNTSTGNENELIQNLLLSEIMKARKIPVEIFENEIQTNHLYAHQAITYDDKIWVFMSGQFRSNIDTWAGSWFSLTLNAGGVAYSPPKFIPPTAPIGVVENPEIVTNGKSDTSTIISILDGIKSGATLTKIQKGNVTKISTGGLTGLTVGQTGRIINPTTGGSELFEVLTLNEQGEIGISEDFENDYPEGSYLIKDISTPDSQAASNIEKQLNQSGGFTDVPFDLPTLNIDRDLSVIRSGYHSIFEADFSIINDDAGNRRRIDWNIDLYNENVLIKFNKQ